MDIIPIFPENLGMWDESDSTSAEDIGIDWAMLSLREFFSF